MSVLGLAGRSRDRVEAARLLLNPGSMAVIGATEDRSKFGGRLYAGVVEHQYPGRLYPINPRRKELLGRAAYPDLASLPETPDVAVVVLPTPLVPEAIEACAARGVGAAIIIASGFAEAGEEGRAMQEKLACIARTTGPRLLGPNCLGLVNTHDRVPTCATVVLDQGPMLPGAISLASHSGALMTTIMSRAHDERAGFRYLVSAGNEADLDVCDFLEAFLEDPKTRSVALVLEHIRRPNQFRRLAHQAWEGGKPITALKIGRSAAGVRSAQSHTAAIAGDDAVVDAVLRADGVRRVNSIEALLSTSQALALAPAPEGAGVVILSTSGGACGFLADLAADAGLRLAQLSEPGRKALGALYEPSAINNPLDLGGMRPGLPLLHPDLVQAALEALGQDPQVHGLVFGLVTVPWIVETSRRLVAFAHRWSKPVVVYGAVGSMDREALEIVRGGGLPLISDSEQCIRAVAALMRRGVQPPSAPLVGSAGSSAAGAGETAPLPGLPSAPPVPAGSGALTEVESKRILAAWGLPVPKEALATSAEEAARLVEGFGGPAAMKVVSPDIAHKTEVGGVRLRVLGPEATRTAYQEIVDGARAARPSARIEGVLIQEMVSGVEVIVGSKFDSQFGPVVLVGLGGVFVELLKDVSLRPAPVTFAEAREMLAELHGYPLLAGFRGAPPADVDALAELVSSFSTLVAALGDRVEEIDLNPVMVLPKGQGARIVDALVVRHGAHDGGHPER